ncbi:MAG: hypothetical protein IJR97_13250 [Clostridia bacterium]|nr:hypothetical protein [Clostridia bacterium]
MLFSENAGRQPEKAAIGIRMFRLNPGTNTDAGERRLFITAGGMAAYGSLAG